MTSREAYILGWVFGQYARAMPDYVTPGIYNNAMNIPGQAWTQASIEASRRKGAWEKLNHDAIGDAVTEIDPDHITDRMNAYLQSQWSVGYFHALAGAPLSPSIDIKAIRKERGMTQSQFAEALGVSAVTVARWETGASKPSDANLVKIREVFK